MSALLRAARARLVVGEAPAEVLELLGEPERSALERVAVPACRAFDEAAWRFVSSGSSVDGLEAMRAAALPGADLGLCGWLAKTSKSEVVEAVERAILRASKGERR